MGGPKQHGKWKYKNFNKKLQLEEFGSGVMEQLMRMAVKDRTKSQDILN